MDTKFKKGDKVIYKAEPLLIREVLGVLYHDVDEKPSLMYKVSSKEVDTVKKEVINGYITVSEDEIDFAPANEVPETTKA